MLKKVLSIGLGDTDISFFNTTLGDSFEFHHKSDYAEAVSFSVKRYHMFKLILISLNIFAEDNYAVMQLLKGNPLLGVLPIICISDSSHSKAESIKDECSALEHGALDFLHHPFQTTIVKNRMINAIRTKGVIYQTNPPEKRKSTLFIEQGTYWDSDSSDSIILQTYVGAAFLLEFNNGKISILRANQKLSMELLGKNVSVESLLGENVARHLDSDNQRLFLELIQRAIISHDEETCGLTLYGLREDQPVMHIRLTMKQIENIGKRYLFYGTLLNDTEQYDALRKVTYLSEQLQIIINNYPDGVTVAYDENNQIHFQYMNDNFYSMFGYTKEEYENEIGDSIFRLIVPKYLNIVKETLDTSIRQMSSVQLIYQAKKRDGSVIWVHSHNAVCLVKESKRILFVTFYKDITRQKRAEERIQTINSRLSNSEIYIHLDITNQILKRYRSIYEPQNDFENASINSYNELMLHKIYEPDKDNAFQNLSFEGLKKHFDAGETKFSLEYQRYLPSGDIRWFAATAIFHEDALNRKIDAFIYSHDIDQKMKQRIAQERIMDVDVDDITIIHVADGSCQIMQQHGNSTIVYKGTDYQKNVSEYVEREVAKEDREHCMEYLALSNLLAEIAQFGNADISYWTIDKDGKDKRKNCHITYLDSTHTDLLMVGRDITDMFEKEQEQKMALQHAVELANYANQAKSDFLSRMSHDMRTPLNTILGVLDLAQKENNTPAIENYLKQIHNSSQFLLGLINDTLDLSKVESGKMELHKEPFPIEEFILGINTVIKPLMDAKNIDFVVKLKKQTKCIIVDKVRFNQIFYNLLSNAAKYTPEGGRVEFSSEHIPNRNGKFGMRFHIKDNGIGMSKDYQKVLFEPFSQEYTSAHTEQRGTGLGLAIVKQIVDLAGGQITVNSEIDKGSEFIVDLYAESIGTYETMERDSEAKYDLSLLRGIRVLLVDDTEINAMIVTKILEFKGGKVDIAENGLEGVNMFQASKEGYYDIILTDIRMPVMDGFEEARQIRSMKRKDAKTIPIIAATADAYSDVYEKILEVGINERLVKPIQPDLLCETIARLLSDKKKAKK